MKSLTLTALLIVGIGLFSCTVESRSNEERGTTDILKGGFINQSKKDDEPISGSKVEEILKAIKEATKTLTKSSSNGKLKKTPLPDDEDEDNSIKGRKSALDIFGLGGSKGGNGLDFLGNMGNNAKVLARIFMDLIRSLLQQAIGGSGSNDIDSGISNFLGLVESIINGRIV